MDSSSKQALLKRSDAEDDDDDDDDVKRSLKQLEEAIKLIPDDEKAAYLQAKEQCPRLVEREPGPIRFLHYERFNVWAAAGRLVAYWNVRRDIFGSERAFLPMHQTGNGALSYFDLELLSTGYASILPTRDSRGSCVFGFVPSRINPDKDTMTSRLRCSFYMMSVLMDLSGVVNHDFSGIMMLNQIGFDRTKMVKKTVEMIEQLPVHSNLGVIAHCPIDVERKTFFEMVAPTIMKMFERETASGVANKAVSANSKSNLADQLAACGFDRDSLPEECGGSWSVTRFRQWQQERIQIEQQFEREHLGVVTQRPSSGLSLSAIEAKSSNCKPPPPNPSQRHAPSPLMAAMGEAEQSSVARLSSSPLSSTMGGVEEAGAHVDKASSNGATASEAAQRLERRRVLDRIHSKRKRARRKERFADLEASREECQAENVRLRSESAFLEMLLLEAKEAVRSHFSSQSGSSMIESELRMGNDGSDSHQALDRDDSLDSSEDKKYHGVSPVPSSSVGTMVGEHARPVAAAADTQGVEPSAVAALSEAERLERKRAQGRIHSKRKRAKRKAYQADLEASHEEGQAENSLLKAESVFLENLLREAKAIVQSHLLSTTTSSADNSSGSRRQQNTDNAGSSESTLFSDSLLSSVLDDDGDDDVQPTVAAAASSSSSLVLNADSATLGGADDIRDSLVPDDSNHNPSWMMAPPFSWPMQEAAELDTTSSTGMQLNLLPSLQIAPQQQQQQLISSSSSRQSDPLCYYPPPFNTELYSSSRSQQQPFAEEKNGDSSTAAPSFN